MCPTCRRRMTPSETVAPSIATVPTLEQVVGPPSAPIAPRFGVALGLSVAIAVMGVVGWTVLAMAHLRSALISFAVAAGIAATMRAFAAHDRRAPFAIGGLTALSALSGLLFSQYEMVADATNLSLYTVINRIPVSKLPDLLTTGTSAVTWVIMAASVYTGLQAATRLSALNRVQQPAVAR